MHHHISDLHYDALIRIFRGIRGFIFYQKNYLAAAYLLSPSQLFLRAIYPASSPSHIYYYDYMYALKSCGKIVTQSPCCDAAYMYARPAAYVVLTSPDVSFSAPGRTVE